MKDIANKRFGRLLAISRAHKSNNKDYYWNCICNCGNTKLATIGALNWGQVNSCGCLSKETVGNMSRTHGMSKTKEYKSWTKIRERCLNKNDKLYADYGGAGIIVEESWKSSFEAFYQHIGPMPKDGKKYTVDRILNSGSYVEGNVRWATANQQARNKGFQKNNTSGKKGVIWDNKVWNNGATLYANAVWNDLNNIQRKKCFSTKVYGLLPAFAMACEYRDKMLVKLNSLGAGYTEEHIK